MITKEQYQEALRNQEAAGEIINEFHRQEAKTFEQRLSNGQPFTDDELTYSATSLCPCGYGLAYPKMCGPNHYWDCAGILKGTASDKVQHTGRLPFAFYDVKSESEHRGTTRGVFKPRPIEAAIK